MGQLGGVYKKFSDILGLQTQRQGIDYSAAHFVHADMTLDEFARRRPEKVKALPA
ncbi:MAG: hypothetical protein ACLRPT_11775 [Akkermansia muciniphila]